MCQVCEVELGKAYTNCFGDVGNLQVCGQRVLVERCHKSAKELRRRVLAEELNLVDSQVIAVVDALKLDPHY